MTAQIPDVVSRYFELDADRDNDGVTARCSLMTRRS
jgi:hypothetical protein